MVKAWGPQGNAYAIPTKNYNLTVLPLETIKDHVGVFLDYADANPEILFNVVAVGCGLAGYKPRQIAPFFRNAPKNVHLPNEFLR